MRVDGIWEVPADEESESLVLPLLWSRLGLRPFPSPAISLCNLRLARTVQSDTGEDCGPSKTQVNSVSFGTADSECITNRLHAETMWSEPRKGRATVGP